MWGSVWATGGREIFLQQSLWTKTSRRPDAAFSTTAVLVLSRETSAPIYSRIMCDACTALWLRELDNDRGSVGEAGGFSGGAGEEDPEMAKTPLQHCCCHYPGGLDNALQSVDQEAEFPPACREQQLCQPERYSPACLER